jgi:hypothetical protein
MKAIAEFDLNVQVAAGHAGGKTNGLIADRQGLVRSMA